MSELLVIDEQGDNIEYYNEDDVQIENNKLYTQKYVYDISSQKQIRNKHVYNVKNKKFIGIKGGKAVNGGVAGGCDCYDLTSFNNDFRGIKKYLTLDPQIDLKMIKMMNYDITGGSKKKVKKDKTTIYIEEQDINDIQDFAFKELQGGQSGVGETEDETKDEQAIQKAFGMNMKQFLNMRQDLINGGNKDQEITFDSKRFQLDGISNLSRQVQQYLIVGGQSPYSGQNPYSGQSMGQSLYGGFKGGVAGGQSPYSAVIGGKMKKNIQHRLNFQPEAIEQRVQAPTQPTQPTQPMSQPQTPSQHKHKRRVHK